MLFQYMKKKDGHMIVNKFLNIINKYYAKRQGMTHIIIILNKISVRIILNSVSMDNVIL